MGERKREGESERNREREQGDCVCFARRNDLEIRVTVIDGIVLGYDIDSIEKIYYAKFREDFAHVHARARARMHSSRILL